MKQIQIQTPCYASTQIFIYMYMYLVFFWGGGGGEASMGACHIKLTAENDDVFVGTLFLVTTLLAAAGGFSYENL